MDNRIKRQIAKFLAGLWLLILLGSIVFRHAHRLPDGRVVSHIHPYKFSKHQFPDHQHTYSELIWLDYIANLPFELPAIPVFDWTVTIGFFSGEVFFYNSIEKELFTTSAFLRGPPMHLTYFQTL